MEKRVEMSILLDYYNLLITDKQKDVMDLYYNNDLSLSEIAEINKTSRQAIHDLIKRCGSLLEDYESKLHLMEKTLTIENSKTEIINKLKDLYHIVSKDNEKETIKHIIEDIIENV